MFIGTSTGFGLGECSYLYGKVLNPWHTHYFLAFHEYFLHEKYIHEYIYFLIIFIWKILHVFTLNKN